jgi:integrase
VAGTALRRLQPERAWGWVIGKEKTMTQTRYQKGYLYRKNGAWHVRYREDVLQKNGSIKTVQRSQKIADVRNYPRKTDVVPLMDELMDQLNMTGFTPEAGISLGQFVEEIYLPYVAEQLRPSTLKGYRDLWENHVRGQVKQVRVRDFKTCDGERLMQKVARKSDLSKTTLKHIKSWFSGVFTYARRQGVINGVNPMQGVSIPKGREAQETYAYSLDEIMRMLDILSEPAKTVVATAAFTGMRQGEIRGLQWEDYTGDTIEVNRSIWEGHVNPPKGKSQGSVPVIAPLAEMLETYWATIGKPSAGFIFPGKRRGPIDLENLSRRVICPALEVTGLVWHGWHAFRRGLATNLHDLGIDDKTIQLILRHSDVSVTQRSYIKGLPTQVTAAMLRLESAITQRATNVRQVN